MTSPTGLWTTVLKFGITAGIIWEDTHLFLSLRPDYARTRGHCIEDFKIETINSARTLP